MISQAASALFVVLFLFGKRAPVSISFGGYSAKIMARVLMMGFTPFLIIAIDNVMIIAGNAVLQAYGGPGEGDAPGWVNAALDCELYAGGHHAPGGASAAAPRGSWATTMGRGTPAGCSRPRSTSWGLCVGYTALLFLLARLAGPLFVQLFTRDQALSQQALEAIHISTLAILPLGVQYELVDGFTGMGQVQFSLPPVLLAEAGVLCGHLLPARPVRGRAVFYAEPISDVLGPLVTILVYACTIRKVLRKREALLARPPGLSREKRSCQGSSFFCAL